MRTICFTLQQAGTFSVRVDVPAVNCSRLLGRTQMNAEGIGCVGTWDRVGRFVLAVALIGFSLFCPFAKSLGPLVVWSSGLIGALLLATAVLARCPLYRILRIHS